MEPRASASRPSPRKALYMKKFVFFVVLLVTLALTGDAAGTFLVVAWGAPSSEWTRALGISAIRIGCSDTPRSCVQEAARLAKTQDVSSIFIAVLLKPESAAGNAAAFAQLGPSHPEITEIGFDDFVGQAERTKLTGDALSSLLADFSAGLHLYGSHLKWGITVYQDELWNGRLSKLGLSDETRAAVDAVHLFPHYRKQQIPLEKSVSEVKRLFPNAAVLLGNYAYDRREYLPCSVHGARCSDEEEISLFNNNLRQSLDLAKQGVVAGIELYPGNFGQETSWKNWSNPRFCKDTERSECIQNTRAMVQDLRKAFSALGGAVH